MLCCYSVILEYLTREFYSHFPQLGLFQVLKLD